MPGKGRGWHNDRARHALAAKGVKTVMNYGRTHLEKRQREEYYQQQKEERGQRQTDVTEGDRKELQNFVQQNIHPDIRVKWLEDELRLDWNNPAITSIFSDKFGLFSVSLRSFSSRKQLEKFIREIKEDIADIKADEFSEKQGG